MIDTTTAAVLWKKPTPKSGYLNMYRCAFSPDGRFLAWLYDGRLLISNVATGEDSAG